MIKLQLSSVAGASKVLGVFEFVHSLIKLNSEATGSGEFDQFIQSIKETKPFIQVEDLILIKDEKMLFLLDNALWVLEVRIKEKDGSTDELLVFSNSVNLIKELILIIQSKSEEVKDFSDFIGSEFKISFAFDKPGFEGLFTPKVGQIWKLISIESDGLTISEKLTGSKFLIEANYFNSIAFAL